MLDIVYHVLLHLKRKPLPPADFFRKINDKPLACHLFESYSRQQDPESLRQFYYQDDRHVDSANLSLIESFQLKDTTERINKIKESRRLYQKAKDNVFETKVSFRDRPLLSLSVVFTAAFFVRHSINMNTRFYYIF